MKSIVLIQPPNPEGTVVLRDHSGKFGIMEKKTSAVREDKFPPLELAYSASLLENSGFEVSIIDSPTLELNKSKILRDVVGRSPDLIIVNTCGVTTSNDLDFAGWLKSTTGIETVALIPNRLPDEDLESDVNIFIQGEPELTVLELCQKFPDFKSIRGVFYRDGGKLVYNEKRELIKNLDEFPFPAYHLLPMKKYSHQLFNGKRFFTVFASRGCPFKCIYCCYPIGYGNAWRFRSPENVLKELKILSEKYKVKNVLFRDMVFNFNPARVMDICSGIVKEKIGIRWRCEVRADLMTKEMMAKMKEAGCVNIHMGVESGDPKILSSIAKCGLSLEKVKEVFRDAREVGLDTTAFFMIGFPGETKESISKTYRLAKEIRPSEAWFSAVNPYPGTELYELAKKKNWIITENFDKYTGRSVVMRTDQLSEKDIGEAVDFANAMFSKDNAKLLKTVFSRQGISSAIRDPKKAFRFTIGRVFSRTNTEG